MNIRSSKVEFNHQLIDENTNDPKNAWYTIKRVHPKSSKSSKSPSDTISVNGSLATYKATIGNEFCAFFSTIIDRIHRQKIESYRKPRYCEVQVETGRGRFCDFTTKEAQTGEIGWS